MSLSSLQTRIAQYQKDLNMLEQNLSKVLTKEADKLKQESRINASITRNTTPATAASKRTQMERYRAEANTAKTEQAKLTLAISKKRIEIAKLEDEYRKEDARTRNKQAAEYRSALDRQNALIDSQSAQLNNFARARHDGRASVVLEEKEYDFFISHASEDKSAIATPLYEALKERGARVWYDETEIRIGNSIRKSIDAGIARSKYGIIILSPHFIVKHWTEKEFNAFFAKDSSVRENFILPIWHNITMDEVQRYSLMITDIKAFNSAILTISQMADSFINLLTIRTENE